MYTLGFKVVKPTSIRNIREVATQEGFELVKPELPEKL